MNPVPLAPLLRGLAASCLLVGCAATQPARSNPDPEPPPTAQAPAAPDPVAPSWTQPTLPPTPSPEVTESAASKRSTAKGKPAPEFTLVNQEGQSLSLASLRGKWVVLYFYPADDTPGCTCQATEFTKLLSDFRADNATVLGVSADSPESHKKFAIKYGLNLTLLSDTDRAVMRQYGAWVDIPEGVAAPGRVIRSTFLIDPTGTIAWHWPEVIPQGHAQRVMDRLTSLQAPQ